MPSTSPPFRFALVFSEPSLESWHMRCLERLANVATLTAIVEAVSHTRDTAGRPPRLVDRLAGRERTVPATLLDTIFPAVPRLNASTADWRSLHLDFILKLGPGTLPPGIGGSARFGLWCFEHEWHGEQPPFFREVYEGRDVTEAALLAAQRDDADLVELERGYFPTDKRSCAGNRERVLHCIAEWPALVCRRASLGVDLSSGPHRAAATHASRGAATPASAARLGARLVWRRLDVALERLFRHPQWNVGLLRAPVAALLSPGAYADDRVEWFQLDGRQRFFSDPFALVRHGQIHLLCEEFRYREGRGSISALSYANDGFTREVQCAITLPTHMSYPFLVETDGEVYCVPETSEANEVSLYRATRFPGEWSKVAVLLPGFAGVDPTLLRHDGRWWLMCTERGPNADVALFVWYASDLAGPWTPHARNPVKYDVRGARPGGVPFVVDGALYRPAQDCSRRYGWRVAIQRVTRLTPTEFSEEPVTVIEPTPKSRFPKGRHTLTPAGNFTIVDGHRTIFVWHSLRGFLEICAANLAHALRGRRQGRRAD